MPRSLLVAAVMALAAPPGAIAQDARPEIRFDNWVYFQKNTNDTERWQYRPRFFVPVNLPGGWQLTQRFDFPIFYTDNPGPENPGGGWKSGIGDFFTESTFRTSTVAENLSLTAGVRLVFPTAKGQPFGPEQWQVAPSFGATFLIPEHRITIAPLARYFFGFDAPQGAKGIRRLDLFPAVTFGFPDDWALQFYGENGISYNDNINKWFVPIDVMLIKRVDKNWAFAIGGAYGVVDDDPQYDYQVYGRLTFFF